MGLVLASGIKDLCLFVVERHCILMTIADALGTLERLPKEFSVGVVQMTSQ